MTFSFARRRLRFKPVQREAILLSAIAMLDLASTIILVKLGIAKEANPILGWYLAQGLGMFIAAKTFLSMVPIAGLEIVGWKYPRLAKIGLRAGILGYVAVYGLGTLQIHGWI
jgi:hypothetical protein